ncbi:carbon-nitrogen hydrolase family protein [Peristeroidobacter soli]|jgi:nitrilase|uniref:carbon-nitrogen hydrolase family protein n=1 Tax=Peristeroidobacter soli TaxID=2497877 RepID=UPI00101B9184|nr:carbon-nitrogen hydrolase family protein [Peristeroidobacter soli]
MKAVLLQFNSSDDKQANLAMAEQLIRAVAKAERPELIVLPEIWTYQGGNPAGARAAAELAGEGVAWRMLSSLARELGCVIHGGSINESADGRMYNTSFVFDIGGNQVARYRKIHLFDMIGSDASVYKESALYSRGAELATFSVGEFSFGCAICYDLRFPELFATLAQRGVDAIVVPAAFTLATGLAHWEVLCRARAIETQTYLLAANQSGPYAVGNEVRANFGNSMVVSPWGQVVARAEDGIGYIAATLQLTSVLDVRNRMPVAHHRVPFG